MFRKVIVSMCLWVIAFTWWGASFAANVDTNQCTKQRFKVTAYYSPLPGQDYYYRGNFNDEVILNGRGTHGASWRAVFNGMLAAPKNFSFGTKIYFPGRGIGQVEDRGGAIVEKGERSDATQTRIDIWAGKWEEGLQRALSFGVQYIDGYVCAPGVIGQQVGIDYSVFPQYEDFFHASLRVMALRPERRDPWVRSLQDYLIALGYMGKWRNTGYYGRETKAAVCKYQQDHIWVKSTSEWCGYFGPQTRYDMKYRIKQLGFSDLRGPSHEWTDIMVEKTQEEWIASAEWASLQEIITSNAGEVIVQEPETLDDRIIEHLFTKGEFTHYTFTDPLRRGDAGKIVRVLQRKLQRLNYLSREIKITGVYDMTTIEAVYAFQVGEGILKWYEDPNVRGFFGPKTRKVMNGK